MSQEESVKPSNGLRDYVVALLFSCAMTFSSFLSLFIALPLLIFSTKHKKKEVVLLFVIDALVVIGRAFYTMRGLNNYLFQVLLSVYIPLSLLAAGVVWVYTNGKRVDSRLLISLLPSFIMIVVIATLLCADRALFESIYNGYKDAFVPLLKDLTSGFGFTVDTELLFMVVITLSAVLMFPITVGASCVTLFLFEAPLHSREGDWDEKLESIEINQNLIWIFIISLIAFLVSRFVSVPTIFFIASMSLMISFLILYGVQGFSVLYTRLSRVMPNLKSTSLFFLLAFIGFIIPGLNIVVLLGVPILGILENFFDLKKRKEK